MQNVMGYKYFPSESALCFFIAIDMKTNKICSLQYLPLEGVEPLLFSIL